jgi:hypothetical protein
MAASIHQEIRRDVSSALGEAQSENCWVEAGIAIEIVRQRLEGHFRHVMFQGTDGEATPGDEYIRNLMRSP